MRLPQYLVDASVLGRLHHPAVKQAVDELNSNAELVTCAPVMLESGFSARSYDDHVRVIDDVFKSWRQLEGFAEMGSLALELQRRLWRAGSGRAIGVFDLLVAAHAIHYSNDRTEIIVVHYDSDYETLSGVVPELETSWIVARGTVP